MKNNKNLDKIKLYFSKYNWYADAYETTYKNEYVIIVDNYPYTEDHLFFEYEKHNNVRIRIHPLGGK